MPDKEVLNTEEAAAFLGISTFTVRRYAQRGTLRARKAGKAWLFYKPDLVAWERGTETPKKEGALS